MVWGKSGSTTLESNGDTIEISGLTPSIFNNVIVLTTYSGSDSNVQFRAGKTTIDTGANYASRWKVDDGSDANQINKTFMKEGYGGDKNRLVIGNITNIGGEDKLMIRHMVYQGTAGAGNTTNLTTTVDKWVDTPTATNEGTVLNTGDYVVGNGSASFDGSNDAIVFGSNTNFNFLHNGGSWTVSFWMKPDNVADRMLFNNNGTTNTNIGIQSILTGGNLRTRMGNGSGDWVTVTKSSFSINTWYFVVITFNGTTLSVKSSTYSGSLSSATTGTTSGSPSTANSLNPFTIGSASNANTTYPYDGFINSFLVYDRVLTSSEITSLHNSGAGTLSHSTDGLKIRSCLHTTGESNQWFVNRSTNQFDIIQVYNDAAGNLYSGDSFSLLGSESGSIPIPTDVPTYSRFEETDTRKIYHLNSSGVWKEKGIT